MTFLDERKSQENGPAGREKIKTERVTGLSRRTRKKIVRWNQMTANQNGALQQHRIKQRHVTPKTRVKVQKLPNINDFFLNLKSIPNTTSSRNEYEKQSMTKTVSLD